jgi:hypothetical protein
VNLCGFMWVYEKFHEFCVWIVRLTGSAAVCDSVRQCERRFVAAVHAIVCVSALDSVLAVCVAVCVAVCDRAAVRQCAAAPQVRQCGSLRQCELAV